MCGYVGFLNRNKESKIDKKAAVREMLNTIVHRGPNSEGIYTDEDVAFGFRRLSIIDIAESSGQPIYNEDKSLVLMFNGEIYNFQELREELIKKGHQFKTKTDSEVLVHGYEEYGVKLLEKLRGMFSFVIWDNRNKKLFAARDIFGIKPFYYTQNTTDASLIFGSEIKSFLKHPAFRKEMNKEALRPYLTFQYSVLDETFFKGVYKLKPGHYMEVTQERIEIKAYWEVPVASEDEGEEKKSLEHYVQRIKETVEESVRCHAVSDVKVGSFLSGGIDSSYLAALLKPEKTFSVGFQEHEEVFNETHLAKELSEMLGIENHRRMVSADECFEMLPTIQYHMDEPQSNPSSVPLYFLAQLAREHVTVVLSGEGADEIFAGYHWYRKSDNQLRYEKLPFALRRALKGISEKLPHNRLTDFVAKGGRTVEETFIGHAKVFSEEDALAVLQPEYRKGPSVQEITRPIYDRVKGEDELTKMQYLDFHLWLPGDILLKADKMSMAHCIELRVPFLDKKVIELGMNIPSEYKLNSENTKYALRKAALEVLPPAYANRTKVGFPVPIRYWLAKEKYNNLLREKFNRDYAKEFFRTEELERYLKEHREGKANHARYLWTVYVFLVWYEKFFIEER